MANKEKLEVRYRSGQVRERVPLKNGVPHGVARTWHPNGALANEQRFRDGSLHGLCRQWNEQGGLLGEFTMDHGSGTQSEWHENGKFKTEFTTIDGRFCGRYRRWLWNGSLAVEKYFLNGKDVTRSAYSRAAAKDDSLPQYSYASKARRVVCSDKEAHAAFIEELLAKPDHADARTWLTTAKQPSLGRFVSPQKAMAFVASLHDAGAVNVIVPGIYLDKKGNEFADGLLVELPASRTVRSRIRQVCEKIRRGRLGSFQPQRGFGESHIIISLT